MIGVFLRTALCYGYMPKIIIIQTSKMKNLKNDLWTALTITWSILMVSQIALAFLFQKNYFPVVKNIGWGFIFLSAIFGILPIFP